MLRRQKVPFFDRHNNSKYALSERLFCGDCGSPYKRATWNIHGRKQIVWRCVNRIEYGTKICGSSPSIPEEELHRAILKAVHGLAANFIDEVAAQINGIYVISSAPKFSVAILILQLWIFFIYH